MAATDCDWSDIDRLLNDLKADGYDPTLVDTSTSAATPEKKIQINVERKAETEEDHDA